MISEANLILILTECFEQVGWGKLPVEENGAVVDVESPAHADEQDLQAAYMVATGRGKDMEMERDGEGNQRVDEGGKGRSAPTRTKHCKTMEKIMVRMVNSQVKMQNNISKVLSFFEDQMSNTHCQTYASQMIQCCKFKIEFLFFVWVGWKGCVIY